MDSMRGYICRLHFKTQMHAVLKFTVAKNKKGDVTYYHNQKCKAS